MNLLNSLRKSDKMLGKPRILSLFPISLNSIKHEHSCKIRYVDSAIHYSCDTMFSVFGIEKGLVLEGNIAISVNVPQFLLKVKIFQFKNVFNFWNVHGIMNTLGLLQSK